MKVSVIAGLMGFVAILAPRSAYATAIPLGTFTFESTQFGDTLNESDGGTYRAANWLNVLNTDPGNPGALTGANFDTGIANLGLFGSPIYTIGYATPIVNGSGDDLAIVDATFSSADTYRVAVSTDGVTFSSFLSFNEATAAVATGVHRSYFYDGIGPFDATLDVIPLDLSLFGLAPGDSIAAVRIAGSPEADLIRVAGFGQAAVTSPVPEPATLLLLGCGLTGLAARRRRQAPL